MRRRSIITGARRRLHVVRRRARLRVLHIRSRSGAVGKVERIEGFTVRVNDAANYYVLVKDIFVKEIYRFTAAHDRPYVLDGGSNIGMSVLYFKHLYPKARIVAFEPDPAILPLLEENIRVNALADVETVAAAVSDREGMATLASDHLYGSTLHGIPAGSEPVQVRLVRLRDWITEPVDFVKLNIEGAEHSVIGDIADRLHLVRELVIEYHHQPGLPRTLHAILGILHGAGFEYLVYDFDAETSPGSQPPFRLQADSSYFLLVYARRVDG